MSTRVAVTTGGTGGPVLLLLHGLGACRDVWRGLVPVLERQWPGTWIAADLPGHGESAPADCYSFGHLASAVATVVPDGAPVAVLGHSLGGVVALALATGWFGVPVRAVCALGVKLSWTDEELARAQALALRPNPVFASRHEAAERYLKLAGLVGLVEPEAVSRIALVSADGRWQAAFDPAAFAVGAPDLPGLLAAARAEVILAAGERDPMSREPDLRALVSNPVILRGLGHNAHVEQPEALVPLLERLAGGAGSE